MLKRDPRQRPTIHELLKVPVLERRIERFLSENVFMDEFSHTLLHNQNVFEEFKRIKQHQAQQQAQQQAEEEKARQAIANLNVYQPPQQYMQQYNDPSFFNYEYQKYKQHLQQEASTEDSSSQGSQIRRNVSEVSDDRN